MSDHKEHITQYSAADLQRYVQGKLSAAEMHAMEKAALDDPFLADAIEGMQQAFAEHDESLVTGQLQQLQQQFQAQTAPAAKVVAFKPFRYWQAAAAAVVVIITGVWIYSLLSDSSLQKNSAPVIAKTEERKIPQQESAPVLQEPKERTLITDSAPAKSVEPNINKSAAPTRSYRNAPTDDQVLAQEKKPATASAATVQNKAILSFGKADTVKQDNVSDWERLKEADKDAAVAKQETAVPPVASAAMPELKKARKESTYNNVFKDRETELITIKTKDSPKKTIGVSNDLSGVIKGQVTDQNSNPIANAYLQIPKNNNNFVTDKTGYFKIPVSDSVVDVAVNVSGYGTQNFRLENNATMNQLQLQPANAAIASNEVAYYKGNRYKAAIANKLPNYIVHDAEPASGWVAFDQYLEKNKKVTFNNSSSIGQVIVSFDVNKKGELSGFKIEQSLSKACDDEAIRLIMQGPGWKLLKKVRKARVTVIVRF
ncbi:MAG: carboxypeptidase-like regulatory domain-containing protein [Niastella sp.]|uniref:carboxypeptidase-like regulatory domain-containing protein n=1 Tax=Niastella sp. TaxID=1869183 RepID=UPI003899B2A1